MKNKRGNVAMIALIIVIVAITTGVITWLVATKTQAPVQQAVVAQPVVPTAPVQQAQTTASMAQSIAKQQEGPIFNDPQIGFSLNLPVGWEKYTTWGTADTGSRTLVFLLPTNDKNFPEDTFNPGFAAVFSIHMNDLSVWKNALNDAKKNNSLIYSDGKWVVYGLEISSAKEIPSDFKVGKGTGNLEITSEYLKNNIKFTN